jgi:hypothetical protein
MVLFQNITDLDINRAWEISPYNGFAFGALVVVLMVVIWSLSYFFLKELSKKDDIIKEKDIHIKDIHDKTHEAIDVMSEKLVDLKYSKDAQNEKIVMMLEHLKEKFNSIK